MKKKLLVGLLASAMMLSLVGCGDTTKLRFETDDATYNVHSEDDRFMKIDSINGWIYVDKETKVQYLFVKRGNGSGLTVLVDSEGNPLLYEEE